MVFNDKGDRDMETTINVSTRHRAILSDAAKSLGISRSWLVRSLVQKAMKQGAGRAAGFVPVRYQERRCRGFRAPISVCYNERDYEWIIDSRRFRKESVSFIVAWAIEKYLVCRSDAGRKNALKLFTHNYGIAHYFLTFHELPDALCWVICLGKACGCHPGKKIDQSTPRLVFT
jgi:hypothetical protein